MASDPVVAGDPVVIGRLHDAHGDPMDVRLWPRGMVEVRDYLRDHTRLVLDASARDKLRELLDRAAMPGQGRADGEAPAAGARDA